MPRRHCARCPMACAALSEMFPPTPQYSTDPLRQRPATTDRTALSPTLLPEKMSRRTVVFLAIPHPIASATAFHRSPSTPSPAVGHTSDKDGAFGGQKRFLRTGDLQIAQSRVVPNHPPHRFLCIGIEIVHPQSLFWLMTLPFGHFVGPISFSKNETMIWAVFVLLVIASAAVRSANDNERISVDPQTNMFVDPDGRGRVFRGVNVVAKDPPYYPVLSGPFDAQWSFIDEDIQNLRRWGFTVVFYSMARRPHRPSLSQLWTQHDLWRRGRDSVADWQICRS